MDTDKKQNKIKDIYRMVLSLAGSHGQSMKKSLLLAALSATVQGVAFGLFVPFFLHIGSGQTVQALYTLAGITVLLAAGSILRWNAQGFDYSGAMADACLDMQIRLGRQLRRIPPERLAEYRSGEIDNTLSANVEQALMYATTMTLMLSGAVLTPLAAAVVTAFYDWRIVLVMLAVPILLIPFARWRRPAFARGFAALEKVNAELNSELVELAQGMPVLRSSLALEQQDNRLNNLYVKIQQYQEYGHKKGAGPNLIITSVVEWVLLLCLSAGIIWVLNGSMPVMLLGALMVMIVRFSEPLGSIVGMLGIYEMISGSATRLKAFMEIAPQPVLEPQQIPKRSDIVFENVGFTYSGTRDPVLRNISLTVPERSLTAVVGASGCGKSTLVKMITRFADPQQGTVRIGGVDIRHIPEHKLTELVSIVFQDVYLFDDTLLNNISPGSAHVSREAVIEAAKKAHCHDFISALPEGYETRAGTLGNKLSGGEKQRISIARALLKDTPIVILDEPTASLDSFGEIAVQKAINALVADKTVIVIAHRLSTITGAGNIVVMDEGRIVEEGTHGQLMAEGGRYARMVGLGKVPSH